MYGQAMIPFLKVVEENIDCDLERDDDNVEQKVKHEVLNLNTIQISHNCLIIEYPKDPCKEWLIEDWESVISEAFIVIKQWFYFLFFYILIKFNIVFISWIISFLEEFLVVLKLVIIVFHRFFTAFFIFL